MPKKARSALLRHDKPPSHFVYTFRLEPESTIFLRGFHKPCLNRVFNHFTSARK